ncbi:hypothetical protein [Brevundimonas sp.]|uniref:hypothetical protein n=1 Tax=Brevundimonas sp. TaxID=1871086 RepID=UPI003BA9D6D9
MPMRPGISCHAFSRLEDEIIGLGGKLSDWQLMELAEDFHAMLRLRRQAVGPRATTTDIYFSDNDNRPVSQTGPMLSGDR